jgi:SAM-dependent methyltransferase
MSPTATPAALRRLVALLAPDNAIARAEWVRDALARLPPGQSILDAGAGEMQYRTACAHLRYVSQDFNAYDGRGDGVSLQMGDWKRQSDITSDICSMPIMDGEFDNVLCTEVLEHIPYPDRAIAEFSRVLRPGGRLLLTAPFASLTHFAPYHFSTGFNRYWYERVLSDHGFDLVSIEPNGNFFSFVVQELVRAPVMAEQYVGGGPVGRFALALSLLPAAAVLRALVGTGHRSHEVLCFGYHVIAIRRPTA